MPNRQFGLLSILTLLVASILLAIFNATNHIDTLSVFYIKQDENVRFTYLYDQGRSKVSCDHAFSAGQQSIREFCPSCEILRAQCLPAQKSEELESGGFLKLAKAAVRVPQGVLLFSGENLAQSLNDCRLVTASSRENNFSKYCASLQGGSGGPVVNKLLSVPANGLFALIGFLISMLASLLLCFTIIRYEHLHAHLSHDACGSGPQKFHVSPTPRIGGVSIILGFLAGYVAIYQISGEQAPFEFFMLLAAAMPAFLGGLIEDLTKRVGVAQRLVLTMLSGVCGVFLVDALLARTGVPGLDSLLLWMPFAICFTAFAVGGVANSINIIDGYNGISAGFGIMASLAFGYVAAQNGDSFLLYSNLVMAGALAGFLGWNWPSGKIFLGDGGAYLLGFWLAEMGILIIDRNPHVSVWFPMAVMIYPVFETLFSIYRRKFKHQKHIGHPDSNHLHQLIYKRLIKTGAGSKDPVLKLSRNSGVAPYIWLFNVGFCALAAWGWHCDNLMLALCGLFCVAYVMSYWQLSALRSSAFIRFLQKRSN